jgi:hypothetical protein
MKRAAQTTRARRALHAGGPDLKAAEKAYRGLSFERQMEVVLEVIETRSTELLAAWRGALGLGAGLRRRRDSHGVARTRAREPLHLRVMVLRKWKKGAKEKTRQNCIPRFVLAKVGPSDDRRLVAVPTDVESRPSKARLRLQGLPLRAWVSDSDGAEGALTCVVQESSGLSQRYLGLSCRHVLSPVTGGPGSGAVASQIDEASEPPLRLGRGTSMRGSFGDPASLDFDAQFFRFDSPEAAAAMLAAGLSFRAGAKGPGDLGLPMELWAPSSRRSARFHTYWTFARPLLSGLLAHRRVIEATIVGAPTINGDSGAPLVIPSSNQRPVLAGMHTVYFGGPEQISYCLPAWDLFNPVLYAAVPAGARWSLM